MLKVGGKKMDKLKAIGIIGTIILVANVFLFAFKIINPLVFWVVIGIGAIFVYFLLPKIQKSIPS